MPIKFNLKSGACSTNNNSCVDKYGCPNDICPDFVIRRHDTKPPFKLMVEDCEGPFDFRGLVIEASMWAVAKLKKDLNETDDYFSLADDIGFEQIMVGDIIVMDRARMPEYMLVTAFDEHNKYVKVQRGYHGTTPSYWKKGTVLRIFKFINAPAEAELVFEDVTNIDGTVDEDVLSESYLVYNWRPEDTCLPGCYWFEFKVIKMIENVYFLPGGKWAGNTHLHTDGYYYTGSVHTDSSVKLSYDQVNNEYLLPTGVWNGVWHQDSDGNYFTGSIHDDGSVILNLSGVSDSGTLYDDSGVITLSHNSGIPSFTTESLSPSVFGCTLGEGVEWIRRFPLTGEGFLIRIENSPTTEISV